MTNRPAYKCKLLVIVRLPLLVVPELYYLFPLSAWAHNFNNSSRKLSWYLWIQFLYVGDRSNPTMPEAFNAVTRKRANLDSKKLELGKLLVEKLKDTFCNTTDQIKFIVCNVQQRCQIYYLLCLGEIVLWLVFHRQLNRGQGFLDV